MERAFSAGGRGYAKVDCLPRLRRLIPVVGSRAACFLPKLTGIVLVATIAVQPASGSAPAAWDQLQRQAERTCTQESGFRRPRVSNMIVFDDNLATVALLVTGLPSEPRARSSVNTKLCLYNRRTRRVALEEAKGWGERP